MGRKAVREATSWQIVGMKCSSMISNREIARRLKILENCVKNTLKTLKTTSGIQRHAGSGRLKKTTGHENIYLVFC